MPSLDTEFEELDLGFGLALASGCCEINYASVDDWRVAAIWHIVADRVPAQYAHVEHGDWPCAYAIPRDGLNLVRPGDYLPPVRIDLPKTDPLFPIIVAAIERRMTDKIEDAIREDGGDEGASDYDEHNTLNFAQQGIRRRA